MREFEVSVAIIWCALLPNLRSLFTQLREKGPLSAREYSIHTG
jgi:hypothetical protein